MSAEPIVIVDSDEEASQPSTSAALASGSSNSSQKVPTGEVPQAAPADEASSNADKEQMECPICLQTCIHPARLPCGHIFCFLCVKGVAYKNRRCAMCRREIPVEFLDHPNLLYKIEETAPTTDDGYQWFYEGRNGWWQYDERTSQEIEDAYKRPDKFCTILVAGYVYVVDFETMLQQRQNEPSRKRQVKRDLATIPKKGVAGLRIDGTADPQESSSSSSMATAYGSSSGSLSQSSSHHQHTHHQHSASRSPLPALVANNLISTIAATDAAIRIASDIIDSTLAHASTDSTHSSYDYRDHRSGSGGSSSGSGTSRSGAGNGNGGSGSGAQSPTSHSSRQDLLNEVQEALNISASGSPGSAGGNAGATGVAASSTSPRLDFFSQTIDEFRSLALSNIAESSTDSDTDDDDNADDDNCVALSGRTAATQSGVDDEEAANSTTTTTADRSPTTDTELF